VYRRCANSLCQRQKAYGAALSTITEERKEKHLAEREVITVMMKVPVVKDEFVRTILKDYVLNGEIFIHLQAGHDESHSIEREREREERERRERGERA
jgi:hypothetical protein